MENQHKSICISNIIYTFTPEMKNLFSGIYRYTKYWLRRVSYPKCHNKGMRNMEPSLFL